MNLSDTNTSCTPSAPPPVTPAQASHLPLPTSARPVVQSAARARRSAAQKRGPSRIRSCADVEAAIAEPHPAWVPFLIRALAHHDFHVQRATRAALPHFGEAAMIGLLRAAAHERGLIREEAVGCLGECGDVRALQPLLLALKHDRTERNVRTACRVAGAILVSLLSRHPDATEAVWAQVRCETGVRKRACVALGNLGDARAVVPLIEMARDPDQAVAQEARTALAKLLLVAAALPPTQARILGADGVPALLSLLYDFDEPLVRLVLQALRAVGDDRALPGVQRLANDLTRPVVRQEALALLSVLQARSAQQQARATLLRGASAPQTRTADALLRPATVTSAVNPAELLRGVKAEQEK